MEVQLVRKCLPAEDEKINDKFKEKSPQYISVCFVAHSGWIATTAVLLQLSGCLIAYFYSIATERCDAFLPFISQVSGSPPQSWIFSVFMLPACFLGFTTSFLLFGLKRPLTKAKRLFRIVSFVAYFIASLGWTIVIPNLFGFSDLPNKFEWVYMVLLPHLVGVLFILGGNAVLIFTEAVLFITNYYQRKNNKLCWTLKILPAIITLCSAYFAFFSLPELSEEEGIFTPVSLQKTERYNLPKQFSRSYIISGMCEWSAIIASWLIILSFYEEMQHTSITFKVFRKDCERFPKKLR